MEYKYLPSPNNLYRVTYNKTKGVAMSNLPRLCEDDIVVIVRQDYLGCKYWSDRGIPSYLVTVIKKLSRYKRHNLARCTVSKVPECMLEPCNINDI